MRREAERGSAGGSSSRNSEVIHAGIYYPTGLVKTRLCVEGKAMLYAFCQDFGVPHKRCGKLLVAVNAGESTSSRRSRPRPTPTASPISRLTGAEARALEPALNAERRCCRPRPGSSTPTPIMLALRGDAEAHGAMIAFETPVLAGRARSGGW